MVCESCAFEMDWGLEVTVCPDRCADITRVIFKGDNMGYFAPCGYVSSKYYDANQSEWCVLSQGAS